MIGKSDDTGEFFNARKIVKNKIKCKKCGDIIESVSVNDFKFCKCGAVAVDGGFDYLRRCGNLFIFFCLKSCKFFIKINFFIYV